MLSTFPNTCGIVGGPPKTRYNRSKSGWFNSACFSDWFKCLIIPYFKNKSGPKVITGDNLLLHLSDEVLRERSKHEIRFDIIM